MAKSSRPVNGRYGIGGYAQASRTPTSTAHCSLSGTLVLTDGTTHSFSHSTRSGTALSPINRTVGEDVYIKSVSATASYNYGGGPPPRQISMQYTNPR